MNKLSFTRTPLAAAFAAALLAVSGLAAAQDTLPDPGNDAARQARMDAAYRDHREGRAEQAEDTIKRDTRATGHAIERGAERTGAAIHRGAERTGAALHRGAERTRAALHRGAVHTRHGAERAGDAVHRGAVKTGHAIRHGVNRSADAIDRGAHKATGS